MKAITKKRLKAILIDSCVSTAVSLTAEYFLRKKIKNEAFHAVVLPYASQYSLEYLQLKRNGQTVGYRVMGLELVNEDGSELTGGQILNRMIHRDTTSTISYLRDRENFEQEEGARLPHDTRIGTRVREIK